jgi:outer membrane protein assembly factor BamB
MTRKPNVRLAFRFAICQLLVLALYLLCAPDAHSQTLLGEQTIESSSDSNAVGQAEAFQTVASTAGTLGSLSIYLDSQSATTQLYLGVYADNAGHPGALLTQGSSTLLTRGAWNTVAVPPTAITSGATYWIAVLGTTGGKPFFRDRSNGSCKSESSSASTLTSLPATWTTGVVYADCPLSAYGSPATTNNPVLAVSPSGVVFSVSPNGPDPAPATVNVTNAGGGTLTFTAASDSPWLSVTPTSGTAPQALQISVSSAGLTGGVYVGHITVTSTGNQGSPASVVVHLTIAQPADWLMVDHDQTRSGNAVDETIISTSNVANLRLNWSVSVDGSVTAQPLFLSGYTVSGQVHDAVIVGTGGNSVYALDATTGATLWRRNFGTPVANCAIPGGFGVSGAPLIDRGQGHIYTVSDDGNFRTLNIADGTDAFPAFSLIANPNTNKVWGGLNQLGTDVYVATASDGCDSTPWRGQIYRVDVSATPRLGSNFVVVPSIAAPNGGGGIWGYGGVSIDATAGRVYAASADDSNMPTEGYTPFADRMLALDTSLNLLGSYLPSEPTQFPCAGAPCDLDFGATPAVFQPNACPTMVAAGNKNGNIFLFKGDDLAASAQPSQILTLNQPNDSLGNGGVGGVPAYWHAGNMLFVSDAGPGANGALGGIVGLNISTSCTLQVAWSKSLGGSGSPNSTPTIANGVVFVGEGLTGKVHAYDASNGTELWNSGTTSYGGVATFAAPIVAQGNLYVGSWGNFSGGGIVGAFSLNPTAQTLSVSPTSLSFTAVQGGSNPASSTVNVTNSGTGALSFTAASDSAWLTALPASGNTPQALTIAVNTNGLAQGTYTGHITVTSSGAQGSPATITVTLTVTAVSTLSSVSLNPTTVVGGSNSNGTVTLSAPAPTGGAAVGLSSNSPSAVVPTSVTVAAGATTATFTATTTAVTASTPVTISGTYGVTRTAGLTVNPPTLASVAFNPPSVVGGGNSTGTVTLTGIAPAGGATVALSSNNSAVQVPASVLVAAGGTTANFTATTSVVTVSTIATITGQLGATQTGTLTVTPVTRTVLFGDQSIESQRDSNALGVAEAFQSTASASGTLSSLLVYLDTTSTATRVYLGVYADNAGHPGTLLSQGSSTSLTKGAWNTIPTTGATITAGTKYWIAILGTTSGTPVFRDGRGGCKSESNRTTGLTALPGTWTTGTVYSDCPLSAYGQ